ncbi:MAG: hypothetical protein WC070_04845 [Candidatus Magasanikbacteria bacterium]
MFTFRQRIFIFSGIFVGLVLVILLYFFYIKPKNNKQENTPEVVVNENIVDSNNPNLIFDNLANNNQVISKPDGTPEEQFLKQMSRFFVERFFTYSNQNNNVHIVELQSLATPSMNTWMNTQMRKKEQDYSGVTTRVFSMSLINFDKNLAKASAMVDAEHVISIEKDNQVEQSKTQKKYQVDFEYVDNTWKVSAVWDKTLSN